MTDLVNRYVHHVGRSLPPGSRAEIEAELRSLIQDQLEDRYGGAPTQMEIATVLAELGDPGRMAASYREEQYLVGPALYPTMVAVLRAGWLIVASIVLFLSVFGALTSPQPAAFLPLLAQTAVAMLQALAVFSAAVVLLFAIAERSCWQRIAPATPFDPLALPDVDDPGAVERLEAAVGIAMSLVVVLFLLYALGVGGLTLRFDLNDPGDVIPTPTAWVVLLIANGVALMLLQVVVLRRNRWSSALWFLETALEVFGVICLYFAVLQPLHDRALATLPWLTSVPLGDRLPEVFAIVYAVGALVSRGRTQARLWNSPARNAALPSGSANPKGGLHSG